MDSSLYTVLLTTTASNILEDLESLRLFSRVVTEYCSTVSEAEVKDQAFQLIFAFDEIVALGYRENVNMTQIRTYIDMDSYDEKVFIANRKAQEREAADIMKRKAKELEIARKEQAKKGGIGRGDRVSFPGGISGSGVVTSDIQNSAVSDSKPSAYSSQGKTGSRGMKLTPKARNVETFVDSIRKEGGDVSTLSAKSTRTATSQPSVAVKYSAPVHILVQEKINLLADRNGGLEQFEINGVLYLIVNETDGLENTQMQIESKEKRNFQMQVHPNIDKKLFSQNSIIAIKPEGKPYLLGEKTGVLKWRFASTDESNIPLTINCWPSDGGDRCDVNIEYELTQPTLSLSDVTISIPLPTGSGNPVVTESDGDYAVDSKKRVLDWHLAVIDSSNRTGSMEFSIPGLQDDFFPISIQFHSDRPLMQFSIHDVIARNTGEKVKFSSEAELTVERYVIQ
eukprot:TRINITY_DN7853_c0_g2_i2.p1 TRINITY_DN7853_c0_g2~~TRINITY_DN7853_c0_g2_i2.p1  ORF type:complete len:453 (-),score=114.69 TRINITY_DN7853_c0_g2_i2:58-1416(-)